MHGKYSVEELIINNSFINYSFYRNKNDIDKWQQYQDENPDEKKIVEDAKNMILALHQMLSENQSKFSSFEPENIKNISVNAPKEFNNKIINLKPEKRFKKHRYIFYAAASVLVIICSVFIFNSVNNTNNTAQKTAVNYYHNYQTIPKEKKVIWLPDSTKVILNSNSTLEVAQDFGDHNRTVTLSGEAFFNVTHDKQKPFIVKTASYKVKVLGTIFNVKAYPEDATSETSLLRGSIELILKNDKDRSFLLKPNEKAVLYNNNVVVNKDKNSTQSESNPESEKVAIKAIAQKTDSLDIPETAWTQNRLEIVNETFENIKPRLERWYGVNIFFNDDIVKSYKYTATFEGESIAQVLEALKVSYPFKYEIKNKNIYLSK